MAPVKKLNLIMQDLKIMFNKKHSWCCGTPEPRIFIARWRNWRKHIIIIYRRSRYIKYFHLLPWSTIASGVRNQLAKFGYSALSTFRDIGLRIWKRFCVIQTNGVSNSDQIWRRCIRVECNQLFKFGTFMCCRSGDIEPRMLKKCFLNVR